MAIRIGAGRVAWTPIAANYLLRAACLHSAEQRAVSLWRTSLSRLLVCIAQHQPGRVFQLTIATDWRVLAFRGGSGRSYRQCSLAQFQHCAAPGPTPITSLKSVPRGVAGSRERFSVQRFHGRWTQIAISMVLLVGALLFVRSYRKSHDARSRHARERHYHCLSRISAREDQARKMKPSTNDK